MSTEPALTNRVEVTRHIAAPAATIFAIVSSPAGHVQIDGSGMLEAAPDSRHLAVGDTFDINMDREPLGDIPDMGKYQVRNYVTRIEPGHVFEWSPGGIDRPPFGHVYGWRLDPVSDSETDVTNYCDWSAIPEEMRARMPGRWPIVPAEMLERSLDNLDRLATSS
jgi:hypothetical protein